MQAKRAIERAARTGLVPVVICAMICCSLAVGCGPGGPPVGAVTGTVTMDGVPLPGALVTFQSTSDKGGRPSNAETDEQGRYELLFSPSKNGALLGEHIVTISTARDVWDEEAQLERTEPERVPPKYNSETELTALVEKEGSQVDFQLESGGFEAVAMDDED